MCVCAGLCVHACEYACLYVYAKLSVSKSWALCPNYSSRCIRMPLALQDRTRREDIFLFRTQLCSALENCRILRKNKRRFAHALEDLWPVLGSWTTTKGHYWEPGKLVPDQDILDLIERCCVSKATSAMGAIPKGLRSGGQARGEWCTT